MIPIPPSAPYSGVLKKLKQISNVGCRMLDGRLATVSNATTPTYQVTVALSQQFDAVRIVFANINSAFSPLISSCKVAVTSQLGVDAGAGTGTNNSAGTWVSVTKNGLTAFQLGQSPYPAQGANGRPEYTVSDWIAISSVARTDAGPFPLLVVRAFCSDSTITNLTCYGNGTDSFTNWATKPDGRVWISRQQTGDQITTPSGFTSTTGTSQSIIVGIQYMARGQVVNVMGVGDSITGGRGTYIGDEFILQAISPVSNQARIAIDYSNNGWSGAPSSGNMGFYSRVIDICESDIKPDVLVFPIWSPNDTGNATITQATINMILANFQQALAACKDNNVTAIIWTALPTNTSVNAYGASDSLRVALNTRAMSGVYGAVVIVDAATIVSGVVDGFGQMQYNATYTTDGIHPNDAGNAIIATLFAPVFTMLIGG